MSEAPKTVWVTKYALEDALAEAAVLFQVSDGSIRVQWADSALKIDAGDWHPTREAALSRAEEMRAAKIASLKRQIKRLEALTF